MHRPVSFITSSVCKIKFKICSHDTFQKSKFKNIHDNQVTSLPRYSSTRTSATLFANLTSPAFVLVHGKASIRQDSNVFLSFLHKFLFKISACFQSGKCGHLSVCLTSELFMLWFLKSRLCSTMRCLSPLDVSP